MPGGDRTGPMGMGPLTGRNAGDCAGYDAPGGADAGWGGGRGRAGWGGGRGRGRRNRYRAGGLPGWQRGGAAGPGAVPPVPPMPVAPPEQELAALQQQTAWLERFLDELRARSDALRPSPDAKPTE